MATLILIRLDCFAQEDWTFDDDIDIRVNGTSAWRGSMDEGDRKSLGNLSIPFEASVTMQLIEKDWPDGDDNLGMVTVTSEGTVAASRAARFTQDDANYTLWYSVYGDVPTGTEPGAGDGDPPPIDEDPADATPTEPPAPGSPTDVGSPSVACTLCRLIVEVRDPVEGRPLEAARVRVAARGLAGVTGPDGTIDFGPQAPGTVAVEASKDDYYPFPATQTAQLEGNSSGTPTRVTLNLSRERIVEVQPRDLRWYVNMDADESAHHGREVAILARIATATPGVEVHWVLDPHADNRSGLQADQRASLTPEVSLTDDDGWARTTLNLSTYGGDKYRVSASLSPGTRPGTTGAMESGWLEVWRKAYYNVLQMRKPDGSGYWQMAAGTMGRVVPAMEKVFVELKSLGAAINVDDTEENFDSATEGYDWADDHTTMTGVPWKINYVVIGHACQRLEQEVEPDPPVNTMTATVGPSFRPYDFNGTDPLVSAKYRPAAGGSWRDFPAGKVSLTGSNPNRRWRVDFTDTGVDPTATPQRVKIEYLEADPAAGWGGSSLHLLICRGTFDEYYSAANLPQVMAGTSIHEPGHSLGLVMGLGWETADDAHSSHCKVRACVMWWQNYLARPHDFHGPPPDTNDPGCHTYMRGLDMSRSAMKPRWGFPR